MNASVGQIQSIATKTANGRGFVLYVNQRPAVSFVFNDDAEAQVAAKKMSEIVAATADVAASN